MLDLLGWVEREERRLEVFREGMLGMRGGDLEFVLGEVVRGVC